MIKNEHRYARHYALSEVGEEGQARLSEAHVLVVGLGGLGCLIAPYLAAAGVGTLTLVDFDEVSPSNLQRQPLYHERDLGRLKVEVARERLAAQNAQLEVRTYATSLEALCQDQRGGRLPEALRGLDLIVDATDRLATRDLICELSHRTGAPHVYGSVNGFEGQAALFKPEETCYRCLFPTLPRPGLIQSCAQGGVLGPAPALVGSAQAMLSLRQIIGIPTRFEERLTCFDLLSLSSYQLPLARAASCPYHGPEGSLSSPDRPARSLPISPLTLRRRLRDGWRPLIIDVREVEEQLAGVIAGSSAWPLSELEGLAQVVGLSAPQSSPVPSGQARLGGEPLDVLFYCAQGPRAERAARLFLAVSAGQQGGRGAPLLMSLMRLASERGLGSLSSPLRCWELVGGWGAWASER